MVVHEDNKLRNLKRALYGCCAVALISMVVVMSLSLIELSSRDINTSYNASTIKTARAIVITVGVAAILIQIVGILGAYKQSNWMAIAYSVISSILSGLCIVEAILATDFFCYYLVVIFFVSSSVGSMYAKHLRKLKKQAINAMFGEPMPGQHNIVYQIPGNGYPNYTGQQLNFVRPDQLRANGHMYMTSSFTNAVPYQSPMGNGYSDGLGDHLYVQPPSYIQSQAAAAMATDDHQAPFQTSGLSIASNIHAPTTADVRLVRLTKAMYSWCTACLIIAPIVMAIKISALSDTYVSYEYYIGSKELDRALVITLGVLTIVSQFLGYAAAYKQSNWMAVTYGVIAGGLAGGSVTYAILFYYLALLLTVSLFISGFVASFYAKHIRRLEKQALNPTVYITGMPGQPNMMYQGQFNYGGQPAYAMGADGQFYATNAYQPQQTQAYPPPTAQPPGYSQSQQQSLPFAAPDQQTAPGTIASHKTMPPAAGWQS
ncbi:unnamed protein product [Medioppia subpectinata]|uniref:Uncharacterized protein n=1 Tax=Medioppia subpectinata TaxID=1979941 RepID=A0A7R9KX77_9ACAR|nr:unnamed protein product [Medioppia subpectinata]CAG2110450.1 unnamed protein product [Medioppia subpectinata]